MQHLNVACSRISVRFYRSYHVGSSVPFLRTINYQSKRGRSWLLEATSSWANNPMPPSQRLRNLDIQDTDNTNPRIVRFAANWTRCSTRFLERRYRCTMQPSSKGKKKKSDALYYVMTQALSIYTLCNYGVVYIEKREAKRNTLKGRESGKGWQNGTRRIALHRGVQLAHLCCNESANILQEVFNGTSHLGVSKKEHVHDGFGSRLNHGRIFPSCWK